MARRAAVTDEATAEAPCPSLLASPLGDDRAAELAKGFGALADPARLRLLSILASAEAGEVCVCELIEPLGKAQGTVSHHLRMLADAGLVRGDRRGRWVWYSVVPDRLAVLRAALDLRGIRSWG